jgi:adenosylhomocysteinase
VPVLVINDNPIKQVAENRHAAGQSVLASFLRIIDLMTNGRCVASSATAPAAKDIAANFRNAYATVRVVEVDPVARLEASPSTASVPAQQDALGAADIVITATGAESVITGADLDLLKDGAVLCNAGHFPRRSPYSSC